MNNSADGRAVSPTLRKDAEHRLLNEKGLLHELQVHRMELEMQNESLRYAQNQAETARLKAESALERYTDLFEFSPVAYFVLNQDGLILNTNLLAKKLLGNERGDLEGLSFTSLLAPEHLQIFERIFHEVFLSESRLAFEVMIPVGQGQLQLNMEASVNRSKTLCLLAGWDISERKQAEDRLSESNTLNASILNSLHASIAVLDMHGVIVFVNNAWKAFALKNGSPVSSNNYLGHNYLDACKNSNGDFFDKESETAYFGIKSVLNGDRRSFSLEYPCHGINGQFWYFMTVTPLQGPPYGVVISHEDVTARKLAKQTALRLKSMLKISMDGFCVTDARGNLLEINEAFAAMCGYTVDELQGWHITELGAIDDAMILDEHLPKIKEFGFVEFESRFRHKDGYVVEVEISAAFLPEFQQYCLYCRNISERKAQDQAIRSSEEKFRSIINVTPTPMILYDESWNITYVNPAFEQLFGYVLVDIPTLADLWLRALPESDSRPSAKGAWIMALELAKQQNSELRPVEFLIRCKNHTLKSVLVSNVKVQFSASGQYLSILYDITERKQIEAKLNAIFDAAVEGIITYGMSREIVSANTAVEAIFGYTREELVGCNINKILPSLPNHLGQCNFCLPGPARALNQVMETEGQRKDGAIVPLELSAASYSVDAECYVTTIVRDISLRKQRAQLDKQHLDELAHVTRLGLMGEMASGIAHEVNQPLSAITSYTQAALNLIQVEEPDLITLIEVLNKTQQQALRAGRIIHRMREFIKNNTQRRSTVFVNTLIHEAVTLCNDAIKQHNVIVKLDLGKNLPVICADHIQLEQVLINLIRNSIDVLQSLPADLPRLLAVCSQLTDDNRILVRVKDNGPGMSEEQQSKILTPFYSTKQEGMGMGLSISRSLIEAHGGTLHFNSMIGKGSSFYFCLPAENCRNGVVDAD